MRLRDAATAEEINAEAGNNDDGCNCSTIPTNPSEPWKKRWTRKEKETKVEEDE